MMFPSRFIRLPEARARFGDRVDRLGTYLTRVDVLADAATEALERAPGGSGPGLFSRMASGDPDSLRDAPDAVRALLEETSRVPVWVDTALARRGGRLLLRAGPLGGLVLGLKSLVLAYASPAGNKPLVLSGRLIEQAAVRLNETARFVAATIAPEGLRPLSTGWHTTLKVRLVHSRVRRMILRSGRWDEPTWGAPINQHDQAGTLLLFSVAVLDGLRQLGLRISADEAEAYMHLWRWSGWLMGVDSDLLPANESEGARLLELMTATQGEPDDDSRALTRALLESPLRAGETETPDGGAARARAAHISASVCRTLIGHATADALGVPRTRWQHLAPVVRRLITGLEIARNTIPGATEFRLREGSRYWLRAAAVGLTGVRRNKEHAQTA